MNNIDKQYTDLLQDILDNGVTKSDRTGTGTLSVFGRQIRHKMSDGFPLITTKKMAFKTMVTELLWFLRGSTNIKFLVDNGCHIWDGDCFANYLKTRDRFSNKDNVKEDVVINGMNGSSNRAYTQEEFINRIKTDDEFAKKWGELGPVYGKQWRGWNNYKELSRLKNAQDGSLSQGIYDVTYIDQIQNLINELKTNPDSRRLMVNAWNVGELDQCVLPPCHYGFQVYTRELSETDGLKKINLVVKYKGNNCKIINCHNANPELLILETSEGERIIYENQLDEPIDYSKFPTRAISLMWNQRSVDTFLGLPFNIASYGLLLEIIAKAVNMVPDELIGNLGDVHLYSNHVEQAKEQIGRELSLEERTNYGIDILGYDGLLDFGHTQNDDDKILYCLDTWGVPTRAREPYPLPTLNINTEFWPYEGGECGEGPLDAAAIFDSFKNDEFCRCLLEEDIQLGDYQSHPTIKAPLSN
jgi:thymidylate synthase